MFRVRYASGHLIYQPDSMVLINDLPPASTEIRKASQTIGGRSYRTISQIAHVGPYDFTLQVAVDQTKYGELINRLALLLVLCLPFTVCLAAVLGYWMSGRVLAPVDRITATAKTIDGANLQRRLPLSGNDDELDQLSGTINLMLERIASSYDRISQFTADASHELRSPVAVVRSAAELILMDLSDTQRVRRGLEDILAESDFMTKLIADLLTLARNGLEENTANFELFDMQASVESIVPRARAMAELKQIEFELRKSPVILPMRGNSAVVERVLTILLDNAIRYTPAGGKVTVTTWSEGQLCGYTVSDTGPGIAREHRNRIFERFYRVDAARTPGDGSCGLGLAIARSLLDMHGGSIHLETQTGKGSSFEVSFEQAGLSARICMTGMKPPTRLALVDFGKSSDMLR